MKEKIKTKRSIRKNKKNILPRPIVLILIITVVVCCIIFIPKIANNIKQKENKIIGSWTTDGYTVYEFYKGNKGALVLPIATYNFNYKIEEDRISIDFENEKSTDSNYEFSFENEKLILKGINKTSGTYIFIKNEK